MTPRTISLVALGICCLLLAGEFSAKPDIGQAILVVGALSLLGAAVSGVVDWLGKRRPRYDLQELRKVHEREELREVEELDLDSETSIMCVHCGHIYGHMFKVCPQCGRAP